MSSIYTPIKVRAVLSDAHASWYYATEYTATLIFHTSY